MGKSKRITLAPDRARPLAGQKAHEVQAFGQLVHMPIALSQVAARRSVTSASDSRPSCMLRMACAVS